MRLSRYSRTDCILVPPPPLPRIQAVAQLVEALATSRKVAGSIPDVSLEFLIDNHSGLGLTQPLTEMSTRNISWEVEAAGA